MIKYISRFLFAIVVFSSCEDYVDVVPDNIATIEYSFRDRVGAQRFLASCYTYLPNTGDINADPAIMGSDELWTFLKTTDMQDNYPYDIKLGMQNTSSPYINYWAGVNNGKALFQGIRNCNYFLDNVDLVGADLPEAEKIRWKGEAKFLKAYYHYYLMRMYGPIPLIKTSLPISSSIDEVRTYRDPLDSCVVYVSKLMDEAAADLPLIVESPTLDMGRITKPIALAIRAEMLVMAASPLFNGNKDYIGFKDNRGVLLFPQTEVPAKWDSAAVAAKRAIVASEAAGIRLYKFAEQTILIDTITRRLQSLRGVVSDRWNEEIIWANTRSVSYESWTIPFLNANHMSYVPWKPMLGPTLEMAEMFYSKNGVPISEDVTYDYTNRYTTDVAPTTGHKFYVQPNFRTAKLHLNREPRFYANLGFDGGYWFGNNEDAATGRVNGNDTPLAMKRTNVSGKNGSLRFTLTGYFPKKPSNFKSVGKTASSTFVNYRYTFPIIRLADLYLLYAEALNESKEAPDQEVYEYVDKVRARAGLGGVVNSWQANSMFPDKPASKDGMREIIHTERNIELCFEGKRFWDVRRWKTAITEMNKTIYGWNIEGDTEGDYYRPVPLGDIKFTTKDYLWPLRKSDILVNKNLAQNPYWY